MDNSKTTVIKPDPEIQGDELVDGAYYEGISIEHVKAAHYSLATDIMYYCAEYRGAKLYKHARDMKWRRLPKGTKIEIEVLI